MDESIAVVSDVHGNREALTAVLADIDARGIRQIFCLGDIVGYGEAGTACLRTLRERDALCVQGNHDGNIAPPRDPGMRAEAHATLAREHDLLTEEERRWLQTLPTERVVEDTVLLVHGALTGRDDYILNSDAVKKNRDLLRERYGGIRFCCFGHTHLPMIIQGGRVTMEFAETTEVELDPFATCLVNPGAVGQPRDRNPAASYAVLAPAANRLSIVRVLYDVAAEQARMRAAGLDERLTRRIAMGI